ncbi:restriction endonuclease subunit S [Staphylococcus canis]|uniref:Restriction endonuclease subunit S n=1 Tax=Staphylococcus canis TaxID=2724942 RepID=A0ABS0T8D4_9STAP|nr:restriction endonuclease subunit S [Staphylococcus canis]MBI5975000.1 restriction endonuclease subunit S [Staphylococcus canis]
MEYKEYELGELIEYRNEKLLIENVSLENYISTENLLPNRNGKQNAEKLPNTKSVKKYYENDILISNIRPYFKKIWQAEIPGGASNDVLILNSCSNNTTNDYLYYYLSQDKFFDYMTQTAKGTKMPRGDKKAILGYEIKVPNIKHIQNYIVNLGKNIDKKIETNKKIIANLEELSQTLFKRWFVDFEFPDENGNPYKSSGGDMVESELSKIPKSWKVDTLGNYIKIKSGKRPKCKVDNKDFENVVPVIGASKIMGYTNDYIYNEKIIIIGRVGTHGVIQRFSTRTWPSDNTFVITSDFESIIYQLLKSIDYISLNRGSTQPLLSQKDIKNTKVAMPTNETLLYKYQNENDHILKMMDQKNIENQKLAQLRDTLLPKLMSGEIEIPDDIEVNEDELSI